MSRRRQVSLQEIEQFLYREARLADEGDYDAWEALWTDDARLLGARRRRRQTRDARCRSSTTTARGSRSRQAAQDRQAPRPEPAVEPAPAGVERRAPGRPEGDDAARRAPTSSPSSRAPRDADLGRADEYRLRASDGELRLARKKVIARRPRPRRCPRWRSSSDGRRGGDRQQRVRPVEVERRRRRQRPAAAHRGPASTGQVGYLDALELETLAWLPRAPAYLLDPSAPLARAAARARDRRPRPLALRRARRRRRRRPGRAADGGLRGTCGRGHARGMGGRHRGPAEMRERVWWPIGRALFGITPVGRSSSAASRASRSWPSKSGRPPATPR